MDWQSLVNQLIKAESIPRNRLYQKQDGIRKEQSAWGDLNSKLESLQSSLEALNDSSVFYGRKATSSVAENPILSASADASTLTGQYAFEIVSMASATKIEGAANAGATLAPTSDVSGATLSTLNLSTAITAGTFMVNGAQVEVATSDSLQDVFDKISTATGGTVTGSYDAATDKVTLAGTSVVLGSASDTSNFLATMQLYSNEAGNAVSQNQLGVVNLNAGLDSGYSGLTNAPTTAGSFKINGVDIAYDPASDTMREIMERVNNSDAGVRMRYDATSDRFNLESTNTGSLDITLQDSAEGFLGELGLVSGATRTLGANATFRVNGGGLLTSASNELTSDVHGIEGLSVTASDTGTETITVGVDNSGAREKIDDFISKYNAVQTYIDEKTSINVKDDSVDTNIFSGNREVSAIAREMRQIVFAQTEGLSSTVKRLADIGIDFEGSERKLSIQDDDKLDDALANNADDVAALFADADNGLISRLDSYLEKLTGTNGTIETMTDTLASRITSLDDQIDRQTRYLEEKEEQITKQFLRMEEAQSTMNQQMQQLTQSLGSL